MSAAAFSAALKAFNVTAEDRVRRSFINATELVAESLVEGSELTGAPGQPVALKDGGNLKASFQQEFLSPTVWQISTNVEYAPYIEDGANDVAFFDPARGDPRSEVGGYHSAKLTEASYADRIIPHAVAKAIAGRTNV